jgi:UDPglucose 6-dehydrogenase
VTAYDPEAAANFTAEVPQVRTVTDRYTAVAGADVLIICTEWDEFRTPDFAKVRSLMASPVIFDGRNMYRPCEVAKAGFTYHSVGRPTAEGCQAPAPGTGV